VPVDTVAAARRPMRREAVENRERLLFAARQVFAVKGLDAPVDEIARAAGVGMGTFYRHFPTKQAIIDELVGDLRRSLLQVARRARLRNDDAGLEALLFDAGTLHARDPGYMQFLWSRSESEQDAVEEFLTILAELLEQGKAAGRIRADLAVTDVWLSLWSLRAPDAASTPPASKRPAKHTWSTAVADVHTPHSAPVSEDVPRRRRGP
jgi:AcrR family transcriptional regulator